MKMYHEALHAGNVKVIITETGWLAKAKALKTHPSKKCDKVLYKYSDLVSRRKYRYIFYFSSLTNHGKWEQRVKLALIGVFG
jgi:hypothetical protein